MAEQRRTLFEVYDDCRQRTGQSPILQAVSYSRAEANKKDPFRLTHILSTPGVKRDGYEIVQSGWIDDDYRLQASPVYWRHFTVDPTDLMGNGRVWKSTAGGMPMHLRGETTFLRQGLNPVSDMVREFYADGKMTATSVRWEDDGPDSVEEVPASEIQDIPGLDWYAQQYGGFRFKRARLIEYSLVPLGLDKNAVTLRMRSLAPELQDALVANREGPVPDGREILRLDGRPMLVDGKVWSYSTARQDDVPAEDVPAETPAETPEEDTSAEPPADVATPVETPAEPPASEEAPAETPAEAAPAAEDDSGPEPADAASPESTDEGRAEVSRAAIPYSIHGNVPIAPRDMAWSGAQAKKQLQQWASSDGSGDKDKIDWAKYRKGFVHYSPDKSENIGSYKGGHHGIVNGRFYMIPRGVFAAAQRLQQGAFDVPDADLPGMRAHIAKEYARLGEKAPWETQAGRHYEQLHEMARTSSGEAVTALREAIVKVAFDLYGEARVREAWEDAPLPDGDATVWTEVRVGVDAAVGEFVADPEERESVVSAILARAAEGVTPIMRQAARDARLRERVAEVIGIGLDEPDWDNTVVLRIAEFAGDVSAGRRYEAAQALSERTDRLRQRTAALGAKPSKGAEALLDRISRLGQKNRS